MFCKTAIIGGIVGALAMLQARAALLNNFTNIGGNAVGFVQSQSTTANGDNYTIVGGGYDQWDQSDSCAFAYHEIAGDFDIAVRCISHVDDDGAGCCPKAGILCRETMASDSRTALLSVGAANKNNNYEFLWRTCLRGNGENSGQWSTGWGNAGAPNNWIRLVRQGSVIIAYAGYCATSNAADVCWSEMNRQDTATWAGLKPLNNRVFVGLSASKHDGPVGMTTRAIFQQYSEWRSAPTFYLGGADSMGQANMVRVFFTHAINPATLDPSGSQFYISGGSQIVNAARPGPQPNAIDLDVETLTEGTTYTVGVTADVLDTTGHAVVPGKATASFVHGQGYELKAIHLYRGFDFWGISAFEDSTDVKMGFSSYWRNMTNNIFNLDAQVDGGQFIMEDIRGNGDSGPQGNDFNDFGVRMIGVLNVTNTANYSFACSGDDDTRVYLSTDDQPANKTEICRVPGWSDYRQYDANGGAQKSGAHALVAGQKYCLDVTHVQGGGGFSLSVAWDAGSGAGIPNGQTPILASQFVPSRFYLGNIFYTLGPPSFMNGPNNVTAIDTLPATFKIQLDGTPPYHIQWHTNGVLVTGATEKSFTIAHVAESMNGMQVSATVANDGGTATSANATLTVLGYPAVTSVSTKGNCHALYVEFTKAMNLDGTYAITAPLPFDRVTNFIVTNVVATTVDITNLVVTNINVTNIVVTNIDGVDVSITNIVPTDITITNIVPVTTYTTNFVPTQQTVTDIIVTNSVITGIRYGATTKEIVVSVLPDFIPDTVTYTLTIHGAHGQNALVINPDPTIKTFIHGSEYGRLAAVLYQRWMGVGNANVDAFLTSAHYLNDPPDATITTYSTFSAPDQGMDVFGAKLTGFWIVPEDATYRFWASSDDAHVTYIATDANPASKVEVSRETGYANQYVYNQGGTKAFDLKAGQLVYLEGNYSDGGGGDHYELTYTKNTTAPPPTGANISIPASELKPVRKAPDGTYFTTLCDVFFTELANQTNFERFTCTFKAMVDGTPPYYFHWFTNNPIYPDLPAVEVTGATGPTFTTPPLYIEMDGTVVTCVVSNAFSTATATATLTVLPAPVLVSAQTRNSPNNVFIKWTKSVWAVGVYTITSDAPLSQGGSQVIYLNNLYQDPNDDSVVILETSTPLLADSVYFLNIQDEADKDGYFCAPNPTETTFKQGPSRICTDFSVGLPAATSIYGNAYLGDDGSTTNQCVHLCDAVNSTQGSMVVDLGRPVGTFKISFKTLIGDPTNGLADGMSFSFGNDLSHSSFGESGTGTGLTVGFQTYAGNYGGRGCRLLWKGVQFARVNYEFAQLANAAWKNAYIEMSGDGLVTVIHDGTTLFNSYPIPGFAPITGNTLFGFGARCGGENARYWLDDICFNDFVLAPMAVTVSPASGAISECDVVNLTGTVTAGSPDLFYQWLKDGVPIPGANGLTYSTKAVGCPSVVYTFQAHNGFSSASADATFTTVCKTTPPTIVSVGSAAGCTIGVAFNEPVDLVTATNPANYRINGGAPGAGILQPIQLRPDGQSVQFNVSPCLSGAFTVTATGVLDACPGHNSTTTSGTGHVQGWLLTDVGVPADPGTWWLPITDEGYIPPSPGDPKPNGTNWTATDNFIQLTSGGSDTWGNSDHARFVYMERSGDFDVQVKVTRLDNAASWSKGGLMARASLALDSAMADTYHDPIAGANQIETGARYSTAGGINDWQRYDIAGRPAASDFAWLRLQRFGDRFLAYHSTNGLDWIRHGDMVQAGVYPITMDVGLFACANVGNNGTTTTAEYQNFATVTYVTNNMVFTVQPTNIAIIAGSQATLVALAENTADTNALIYYQWQRGNGAGGFTNIPGAINTAFTTPFLLQSDSGVQFQVVAYYVGTRPAELVSSFATITVGPNPNAAKMLFAAAADANTIMVRFSTPMDPTKGIWGATNIGAGGMFDVLSVEYQTGTPWVKVNLDPTTSTMTAGGFYGVGVYGAKDLTGNNTDPYPLAFATFNKFGADTTPAYIMGLQVLPIGSGSGMLPIGSKTYRGFNGRMVQTTNTDFGVNSTGVTEQLLAGTFPNRGVNWAMQPCFGEKGIINYNIAGPDGRLQPDKPFPGIPNPAHPASNPATDQMAMEVVAYVQLQPGLYRWGVNSDDGFRVQLNPSLKAGDPAAITLGEFSGGRGASDTTFDFVVPSAGLYPMRMTWEQGTGGGNVEFWNMNLVDGSVIGINETNGIPAYMPTWTPLVLSSCAPGVSVPADTNLQGVVPDFTAGMVATVPCGVVSYAQVPAAGTIVGVGPTPVTITAMDEAGVTKTCQTVFTVEAPITSTPEPKITTTAEGNTMIYWDGPALGVRLYSSPTATGPMTTLVAPSLYVTNGGVISVTVTNPASKPSTFYRLKNP